MYIGSAAPIAETSESGKWMYIGSAAPMAAPTPLPLPPPAVAELEDFDEKPEVAALVVPAARVVVVRDAEDYSFEAAPRSAAPHRLEWVGCKLGAV